jgi:hypothetical protein
MSEPTPVRISADQLTGLKYLDRLSTLLQPLRPVGCDRDHAGNRTLFYDQYCSLLLLYLFNPIVTSLRGLQQASQLDAVRERLGVARASLGSLSEAARVFDPEALAGVVRRLTAELPDPGVVKPELRALARTLVAVDGSFLKTLPQITQACFATRKDRGWKLHTHFEVLRGVPVRITLTDAAGTGDSNEKAVLKRTLEPDRCYVIDRGYEEFALFNAIVEARSSYVGRIRGDRHFLATDPRALTAGARAAGVIEDAVGVLGSPKSRRIEHPDHPVRRIVVRVDPHPKRGGRGRPAAGHVLVIVTDMVDVPAELIAAIYRDRWMIELFFRTLKHLLGLRHLLSTDPRGITIQTYCAMIACLLIVLTTGRQPTKRTWEMLCWHFLGVASDEELSSHLSKLKEVAKKTPA